MVETSERNAVAWSAGVDQYHCLESVMEQIAKGARLEGAAFAKDSQGRLTVSFPDGGEIKLKHSLHACTIEGATLAECERLIQLGGETCPAQ